MRGIQYAAAFRFNCWRLLNTGSSAGACHRLAEGETRWRTMTTKSVGACVVNELPRIQSSNSQAQIRLRVPAARCARVVHEAFALKTEGAGNAGRPVHPQPRAQCRKHTS